MRHPNVPRSIRLSVCLAIAVFVASIAAGPADRAEAREGNRTLKLYFGHTKERGEFTFKRNGRYDKKEIARINQFLRDWRRNEPAKMDPQLLDLVWAINKEAGGRDYINVVSAYRSLKTNNMLRSRSRGVAQKSQHTAGRAMDFFIPGVPLAKLRAAAMKFQRGGVGYYPTSGSPFVHVDTGSVRYWPRMPRKQLLAMFPNGETLYLPADGKPLQGYEKALARNKSSGGTALAYLETGSDDERSGKKGGNWLKRVFSGGADEAEDNEGAATAAAPAPAPAVPATPAPAAQPPAPIPAVEPGVGEPQMLIAAQDDPLDARLPRARPGAAAGMMVASLAPAGTAEAALESRILAPPAAVPPPRSRPDAQLLAQTLRKDKAAPAPLAVDPDDAIGLLTLGADPEPTPESAAPPVQVAALSPDAGKAPPSREDLAAIDAFTAIDDATAPAADGAVPMPRPRPLAMAFAASGLPAAEPAPEPAAPAPALDAVQPSAPAARPSKGDRVAAVAPAPSKAVVPAYDADQDTLRDLLGEPESDAAASAVGAPAPALQAVPAEAAATADIAPTLAPKGDFGGLAMPQPAATPEFFAVPPTAKSVAPGVVPVLPTDRFQPTGTQDITAEAGKDESFLSRLFANLAQ